MLKIDPERIGICCDVPIRAQGKGGFEAYDVAELEKGSLLKWLRSRGGDNPWAEDLVGILLGHGHLHSVDDGS